MPVSPLKFVRLEKVDVVPPREETVSWDGFEGVEPAHPFAEGAATKYVRFWPREGPKVRRCPCSCHVT